MNLMNAGGLGVTPERLSAAADRIDAAVRGGRLDQASTPVGGADYGHPGLAGAVEALGAAVRVATEALLARAEGSSEGLRAGGVAYLEQEQAGLAELMGVTGDRRAG